MWLRDSLYILHIHVSSTSTDKCYMHIRITLLSGLKPHMIVKSKAVMREVPGT